MSHGIGKPDLNVSKRNSLGVTTRSLEPIKNNVTNFLSFQWDYLLQKFEIPKKWLGSVLQYLF